MRFRDLGRWNSDANARREDLSKVGEGRDPGLHLSEVIQALRQQAGLSFTPIEGEPEWLAAQDGFLWEHALEFYLGGVPLREAMEYAFKRYMADCRKDVVRQLKTQRAGILMTPDGYDPITKTLESYKRTKYSLKWALDSETFQAKFWPWIVQEGCYQLALTDDGYEINRIVWFIYFVNGNYIRKPYPEGISQEVRMIEGVLSKEELDKIWSTVSSMALRLRNKPEQASVTKA